MNRQYALVNAGLCLKLSSCLLLALLASYVHAIPMASFELLCGNDREPRFGGLTCGNDITDAERAFRFEELARVSATRSIPPVVTAEGRAIARTLPTIPNGFVNSNADIDAVASVAFAAEISEDAAPPFRPTGGIPIFIFIEGSLEVSVRPGDFGDGGSAFAAASVQADGAYQIDELFTLQTSRGTTSERILKALQRNCFGDCFVEFSKSVAIDVFASLLAPSGIVSSSSAFAEALLDPFLAFDQETFDQIHGPNSFELASFYSFVYSPNLSPQAAPEPTTLALFAIALAGIGFARKRVD